MCQAAGFIVGQAVDMMITGQPPSYNGKREHPAASGRAGTPGYGGVLRRSQIQEYDGLEKRSADRPPTTRQAMKQVR